MNNNLTPEQFAKLEKQRAASRIRERERSKKFDALKVRVPKGERAMIRSHAKSCGETMNDFLVRAIQLAMDQDLKQVGDDDNAEVQRTGNKL